MQALPEEKQERVKFCARAFVEAHFWRQHRALEANKFFEVLTGELLSVTALQRAQREDHVSE